MSTTTRTLSSIPDELLLEIGKLLGTAELAVIVRVCKQLFNFFEPQLYQSPTCKSLSTLALMPEDRIPLADPHPAKFVRKLSIGCTPLGVRDFAVLITKALGNIKKYAPGPFECIIWDSKRSRLSIGHILKLGEMHAGLTLNTLNTITSLQIVSPFPRTTRESSFHILVRLY
jgi:hypothetical protein